jgi:type II secretory pathway pseudopilin PulG
MSIFLRFELLRLPAAARVPDKPDRGVPHVRTPRRTWARRLLRREEGFGLIESVIAMSMFAVVSAPLAGVMLASIAEQSTAHERTLAAQTAQTALEQIRSLPYDSIGVVDGNPAGTVQPTMPAADLGIQGLNATVTTRVSFMDDAPATSYRTRADYKRVVVTVNRNSDGRKLTQQATYVAPPGAGAYAGQSQGIVIVQVVDYALNTPVQNATVLLSGGPSPARNDLTDASGQAVFPSLLPTGAAPQDHYDATASVSGYTELRDDLPPSATARTSIVAGQTFQTALRVYKGCTITVNVANANGTAYTGSGTVTLSSARGTQSYAYSGSPLTVTGIAGELIVPSLTYTARFVASNGMYATGVGAVVPNAYPTDLTKMFTTTLNSTPATMVALTVKVVNASSVVQPGASVTVSGGPGSNILLAATADASGLATFSVPSNSSPGYTWTAKNGALAGSGSGGITGATTKTVTIR